MNLRALAEKDLAFTLEDAVSGGACELIFTDTAGNEYTVNGRAGDIGFTYDSEGNPISTRVVQVTFRMASLTTDEGDYLTPKRGWSCGYTDLSGKSWLGYVTRFEPDRTLGVGRCWLSFDLSDTEDVDG